MWFDDSQKPELLPVANLDQAVVLNNDDCVDDEEDLGVCEISDDWKCATYHPIDPWYSTGNQ